ncbi:hypothetical protein D081_1296 [Anaerovibrio sp. JC8]|uniref:hypothetical protein n=1 Tax=Anaerovibrio sp. JC8 TaxID=1240085 RepID=UPI000A09C2D5|nr:hypothetical protein [Anaerovibrio sp. JC8]ORU00202.1 hypothetical protein D081_1296 [Anaerovibrio sp. JC8]
MATINKETTVCASCRYWGGEHHYIDTYETMIEYEQGNGKCRCPQMAQLDKAPFDGCGFHKEM